MPQLPVTVNANITRIDAPFPEQWRQELFQFGKGLEEIKALMVNIATSLTESKEVEEMLLKAYSAEAVQARASMTSQMEPVNQGREETETGKRPGASTPPEPVHPPTPPSGNPYEGPYPPFEEESGSRPPESEPRDRNKKKRTPYQEASDYLDENSVTQVAHYGGNFTVADLLNVMAQGTRTANEKYNGGAEGTRLAGATERLTTAAHTWIPNAQAVMAFGGKARAGSEALGSYAGALGYEPGNGMLGLNSVSGPLGTNFRIPLLNSAALSGISSTAEAYETAMHYPGLSGSQVKAMNQGLAERGWFPGQKGQQELFDAQAQLIGKGGVYQQLGESPTTAEMLDEGARYGNASMEEMLTTIEEIPEAAKSAHEGVEQFQASMREVGEYNESIGGTKAAGQRQAIQMSQTTGMPIQAVKGLLESPFTQSAIFRATGTPSWAQGSLPEGLKNEIATKEFFRLAGQVGKGERHTYKVGSFEGERTAKEDQAARIHMLEPSISYEAALKMLREGRTGMEGRSHVTSMADMWKENAMQIMGSGREGKENEFLRATKLNSNGKQSNFGQLLHEMGALRTADGKRMYSQGDIKDIRTNEGRGYQAHGKALVEAKYREVQKILNRKAGKDANAAGSPGSVVLELSPQAKQLLRLPNKRSRIKLESGAGENQTNNGAAGYTDNLSPAEASNDWSYGPGSLVGGE